MTKPAQKNTLLKNIESLRQDLISARANTGKFFDNNTIEKSKELDKLLNQYNKLIYS